MLRNAIDGTEGSLSEALAEGGTVARRGFSEGGELEGGGKAVGSGDEASGGEGENEKAKSSRKEGKHGGPQAKGPRGGGEGLGNQDAQSQADHAAVGINEEKLQLRG